MSLPAEHHDTRGRGVNGAGEGKDARADRFVVRCLDGPLEGASFTVGHCPRVVRCVLATDGTADILNEPDDAPRLDEQVHWYRWDGRISGHICARGRGCTQVIHLESAPNVRDLRAPDPLNPRNAA